MVAPRRQVERSLEEWSQRDEGSLESLQRRGAEIDALGAELEVVSFPREGRIYSLTSPNWHPRLVPRPDPRREARFEPSYVRQRFLEWQASFYAAARYPILGAGLGAYQAQISRSYLTFKKLKTLEPDSQSGYAVELVTTGLAGLLILVWFFVVTSVGAAHSLRESFASPASRGSGHSRSLMAGILTAPLVGAAVPLFTCFLTVLVVFMAAAVSGSEESSRHSEGSPAL
jgi:hypothetical protein